MTTKEVLALLYTRFPKAFHAYEARRRPLKIGIHCDLATALGETVERKLLRRALKHYFVNVGYQHSVKTGAERIDLDGEPAGVVTEEEAENARRSIAGINSMLREIKKQKRLKQREKEKKPEPRPEPRRDGLAALREAATRRRQSAAAGGGA